MSSRLREYAHDAIAVLGVLLAMQGAVTQYVTGLGVDVRIISAVFGGAGLLATILSKAIDSRNNAAVQTAAIAAGSPAATVTTVGTPPA